MTLQITTIDLGYKGIPERAAAYLIESGDSRILVDCGPARCQTRLEAGLAAQGFVPAEITHLLLTHIHLDHAGASGYLSNLGAQVHVHPRGAPHLLDPSRLNRSARRVFGEELDTDLGELEPSPSARVHPVADEDVVSDGTLRLMAIETPGHASHHHAWLLEDGGTRHLFCGDTAGMRIPGTSFVTLPLVAPEFDRDLWLASIERVRSLRADTLWLTHFGSIDQPDAFLDQAAERISTESAFIVELLEAHPGLEPDQLAPEYHAWHLDLARPHGIDQARLDHFCDPSHYTANIAGVGRWHAQRD